MFARFTASKTSRLARHIAMEACLVMQDRQRLDGDDAVRTLFTAPVFHPALG
jgi:hypothetical protein